MGAFLVRNALFACLVSPISNSWLTWRFPIRIPPPLWVPPPLLVKHPLLARLPLLELPFHASLVFSFFLNQRHFHLRSLTYFRAHLYQHLAYWACHCFSICALSCQVLISKIQSLLILSRRPLSIWTFGPLYLPCHPLPENVYKNHKKKGSPLTCFYTRMLLVLTPLKLRYWTYGGDTTNIIPPDSFVFLNVPFRSCLCSFQLSHAYLIRHSHTSRRPHVPIMPCQLSLGKVFIRMPYENIKQV